ncbi:YqcI/YcgG family-domain-containing protein [Suillus fuscotomentosus]|uniref:YqcI/YcgG family-domain-containing protein n=1 Tax=Suillus fuscotomentosus TaxID=1912939 RepID=A0AAD4E3S9_9AGAM|nr:YqcI/YcgG family-domain-containing protein [Suillus fuscotomentosus]KAG1898756.1 YqcI/YcgG family-domain-containing protein [Suillus fuscotomentosus]
MFDVYTLAAQLVGGVILILLANAVSIKSRGVPKTFQKILSTLIDFIQTIFGSKQNDQQGIPLTRAQVTAAFPEGTWQRNAYEDYKAVLLDEELVFPCVYATKGFKSDDQLYLFIDSDDLSDTRHIRTIAKGLSIYLPQARQLGPNTSLVLLAKQNEVNSRTVEEYNTLFWELLNGLAKLDEKPWPSDTPRDIDTDRWCFCFGGEQFFTVIQTPAHQVRRTRYAPGVTMVMQPKWIFDILFSTDAKRAGALAKVRALLAKYDPIPLSPEMKNYGDEGSRESKQYYLLDENVPASCPYERLSDSEVIAS